jgi:prephenate dehydrogenase
MSPLVIDADIEAAIDRPFDRIAILGLGLLGGSVALAARERGLANWVVGAGRRPAPLEFALDRGIVDEIGDVVSATRDADLVLLATPISSMATVLKEVSPHLAEGVIVTDVGSVKGGVAASLPSLLPSGACFVGSHPMAGSHLKGVEHAQANLFERACCVITPLEGTPERAVDRLKHFWRALGARVLEREPGAHDEQSAWISHAPHALAFAFAHALGVSAPGSGEMAGSGFRDFTRIARSDAELWGDILSANRKSLAAPLEAFGQSLSELARAIEEGDANKVEQFLTSAGERLATLESSSKDE